MHFVPPHTAVTCTCLRLRIPHPAYMCLQATASIHPPKALAQFTLKHIPHTPSTSKCITASRAGPHTMIEPRLDHSLASVTTPSLNSLQPSTPIPSPAPLLIPYPNRTPAHTHPLHIHPRCCSASTMQASHYQAPASFQPQLVRPGRPPEGKPAVPVGSPLPLPPLPLLPPEVPWLKKEGRSATREHSSKSIKFGKMGLGILAGLEHVTRHASWLETDSTCHAFLCFAG